MSENSPITETAYLLNLLLYRPKAFLLLSLLKLRVEKNKTPVITFLIQDVRAIGGRVVLTKEQVRANLKLLQERGDINVEKSPWSRSCKTITLLKREV